MGSTGGAGAGPGSGGGGRGATVEMCVHAFDALHSHFRQSECPPPGFPVDEHYPLFVTWNKRDSRGHLQLRGCIGSLRAQPILAIKDYALTSALHDRRFPAIVESELPHLECTVSLLTNFELASAWDDWELGLHGIWIDFDDPQGIARNGTYLPDVPPEQGWTKHETIDSLVRKAGYNGVVNSKLRSCIRLTRYRSTLSKLSYFEYTQILAANCRRS